MSECKLVFGEDGRDTRANEILEKVFNLDSKRQIFISDALPIEFFLARSLFNPHNMEAFDQITLPGHKRVPFSLVPLEDRSFYDEIVKNYSPELSENEMMVYYPPIVGKRARRLSVRNRIRTIAKVEKAYGIKLKHFKNIDVYPKLGINDVASYIDRHLLDSLGDR